MTHRRPLRSLDKFVGHSRNFLLVSTASEVDVNIVGSKSAEGGFLLNVCVAASLDRLGAVRGQKVIVTVQALIALHAILQLELDFGVCGTELERDLVYNIGSQAVVSPPEQKLVPLMLKFVLLSLEVVGELVFGHGWTALVRDLLDEGLVQVVGEQRQRLRGWCSLNLIEELIPELILCSWLLEKGTLGLQVEHSLLTFVDVLQVDQASLSQISVGLIFLREAQMQISHPLFWLILVIILHNL